MYGVGIEELLVVKVGRDADSEREGNFPCRSCHLRFHFSVLLTLVSESIDG